MEGNDENVVVQENKEDSAPEKGDGENDENVVVEENHEKVAAEGEDEKVETTFNESAEPDDDGEEADSPADAGLDDKSDTLKDGGNTNDSVYAYLNRPLFSSEQFKIEIMNLPKYYGPGQLKKFFAKEQIKIHKVKLMGKYMFATFLSEEDRQIGMQKIKGAKFKGKVLDARLAKPMQDPLVKKRKAEEARAADEKKPRVVEPIDEQITKKTTPYAGKPYDEQLELKKQDMVKVLTTLSKEIKKAHYQIKHYIRKQEQAYVGLICPLVGVVPSPVVEKYRNKCDFTIGVNPETDELTVGFRVSSYKAGSCAVGPVAHVSFIPDAMKDTVRLFEQHFRASGRKAFEPEDHSGFWRQLLLRANLQGQILAIVMVHPQNLTAEEMKQVKSGLRSLIEGSRVVSLYFQAFGAKKANEEPPIELLAGDSHLIEELCGLEFAISPLAFFQVNTLAAEVLYNTIGEVAKVDGETDVLDVCCGTGTIGLSQSKICRRVFGVELIPSAVEDAKSNAERNGITNCVFVAGKAEDELPGLLKQIEADRNGDSKKKTVAIVDPPRAGLHRRGCQLLRSTESIERLVYVSCNAEAAMKSFIDLCRAESNAYAGEPFVPVNAIAVDLFPDTPHCELILVLERYRNVK